ncbi:TetR/AcrR family transcriptional regulator [Pseudonocardia sp. CA-107938]|uniref:TetR/AcrR family transcriptional regulator n=1 Tax=Pseudonocardia sp. CA-107938 TaxID=3240021 RepID=UPI003D8BA513
MERRRGSTLEHALLAAAWAELQRTGYAGFTIDAVARAAGTSRAVLYRRWPNRAALVHATVRAHAGSVTDRVPDTGSLDGDVRALLRELAAGIERIGVDVATGLLGELDEIPDDVKATVPGVVEQVVERARARGEIGDSPVPEAVLAMPGALIRYHVVTERAVPSQDVLDGIADQLLLPLVRHHAGASR